ncbi:MAG: hypothetical protein R2875_00925 [Desulfobacterales bacterium]
MRLVIITITIKKYKPHQRPGKKLHHSAAQKTWRKNHRPALSYDDNLPIVARRDDELFLP